MPELPRGSQRGNRNGRGVWGELYSWGGRAGRGGIYTLAAHWSASPADQRRDPLPAEIPCAACHLEHRGRRAEIARVADSFCLGCHDFGSFSTGHPEFDFAADEIPDSDSLIFTHSHHVNELMRRRSLTDPEAACLACHEPGPPSSASTASIDSAAGSGGFRPIDFDRHCAACHLTAAVRTPPLPVAQGARQAAPASASRRWRRRGGGAGRPTAGPTT